MAIASMTMEQLCSTEKLWDDKVASQHCSPGNSEIAKVRLAIRRLWSMLISLADRLECLVMLELLSETLFHLLTTMELSTPKSLHHPGY